MKGQRNFGLDVVRMAAIIPVLLVHYTNLAFKDYPPLIAIMGEFGVDMFFALSGFLIGGIILRDFERGFSWRVALNFYVRRWMRTLPLYYVFFVANAFVTAAGLRLDPAWAMGCYAYLLFLQNLAWPMLAPWYLESWSLAVEEWFYLLFPVIFGLLPVMAARARVLAVALILMAMPLLLRIWAYDAWSSLSENATRIVVTRLDSIAFGILAISAVTAFPLAMRRWRHVIGLAGMLGTVVSIRILEGHTEASLFFLRTVFYALTSASFAAIVIWANFQSWTGVERGLGGFLVRWFSTRSYALYLCHGSVLRTMLAHSWFARPLLVSSVIFVSGCVLLAEIAHRTIELPAMRRRPREAVFVPIAAEATPAAGPP
jgi:peptidoglycan/LPS O-acetylase OafA/YrhL